MREQKRNARKQILVGKQADGIYTFKEETLKEYKRRAISIAKDFGYETIMPDVYNRIEKATFFFTGCQYHDVLQESIIKINKLNSYIERKYES